MRTLASRRSFLVSSAAVVATASLSQRFLWAAHAAGLKLGIQLYSLRGFDLNAALKHAAQIGFSQVEFYSGMLAIDSPADLIEKTKKQVADLGMSISAHGVNGFGSDRAANRKTFEFAKALGIKNIAADPSPESFEQLDELVKEFDIRIAIHNHGPNHRYNKVVDVLHAIENHDERIGACADLGHFIRSGEDPVKLLHAMKGRVWGVHLKDFDAQKKDAHGVVLGKGLLDVAGVFKALKAIEFPADGALSLEYEENPMNPIGEIQECIAVAAKAAKSIV